MRFFLISKYFGRHNIEHIEIQVVRYMDWKAHTKIESEFCTSHARTRDESISPLVCNRFVRSPCQVSESFQIQQGDFVAGLQVQGLQVALLGLREFLLQVQNGAQIYVARGILQQ